MFFSMNFSTPKLMKIRWSSFFFGSFAPHFQIKLSICTGLKFQLQICKYEWARIIFVDGGLDSKLQHYGPYKNSRKKSKTSHSYCSSHSEGNIMQNHEQKKKSEKKWKKVKKSENKWKTKILWAKQTIFWEPCPSALGQFQPHGYM
jgi:hypothetical protein